MYRFLGKKEPLKIYKTQSKSLKKMINGKLLAITK